MSKVKKAFDPDHEFMALCEKGDLENIKKLLTVYTETDIFLGNNYGLIQAVIKNHPLVVDYLLEKTALGKEPTVYGEQGAYLVACDRGYLKMAERLFKNWLEHKELQEAHPYAWEFGFSASYVHENEHGMRLFLENPIMKPFANIHLEDDNCFVTLYKLERKDLLETLIFDFNIDKTQAITDFLNNPDIKKDRFGNEYKIDKKELIELFEKRDFINKLNENLPEKNIKTKSKKI